MAVITDQLSLNFALGYLDATYEDFPFVNPNFTADDPNAVIQLKGERLQNAPEWTSTASINYEMSVAGGTLTSNLAYRYNSSKYYTNVLNTQRSKIQPIKFVDANVDWTPSSEQYTLSLWARNLLDERYVSVAFDSPGALALVGYHPPREWGASFKYHF